MELGEVYNKDGMLSYEKLFYFHFRKICNMHRFWCIDGNKIITLIEKQYPEKIKELYKDKHFDNGSGKLIEKEAVLILFSEEIISSDAYSMYYLYGEKRILTDEFLKNCALEFKYSD